LPDYADVYFDNVGGEILDVMLPLVKRYGKVAVCGAIASEWDASIVRICTVSLTVPVNFLVDYNGTPMTLTSWREVIYNSSYCS
jgi:NADPH:quinone reductase-like Zn-dependent oxidoreductase